MTGFGASCVESMSFIVGGLVHFVILTIKELHFSYGVLEPRISQCISWM